MPVTVMVYVPEGVEPTVVSVSAGDALGITDKGLMVHSGASVVTMDEVTVQVNETELSNPPMP